LNIVAAVLGSAGLMSAIYITLIIARLSQKLGAVTKMQSYYRGFYVSTIFLLVSLIAYFLKTSVLLASERAPAFLNNDLFYLLTYYLPFAIGTSISLVIVLRYWDWLLKE
jgi:hypothetical protein